MSDIADEILEGDRCQECAGWIGNGDGFPRKCKDCRPKKKRNGGEAR